ncbi:hypothetical protein B0H14DRAFT_2616924 [Mycena olivaceomarginata]|nr:hypothetical protein B0H14DRAFT_2616924 [Mycena olivaceomarginata]
MSAGEELRRSSRIQQLTRLKAPEKQVKSSLRKSKAPDDEAPSPKKVGSSCLPSICVTNNVLLHQRKPAVTTSTPSHIGSVHPTTSMKLTDGVGTGSLNTYDRGLKAIPEHSTTALRYRVEARLGLTGVKMEKYLDSWYQAIASTLRLVWRPRLIGTFEGIGVGLFVIDSTGHDILVSM